MKWTTEKPTAPGWYWKREKPYFLDIVQVRKYRGKMSIMNWEISEGAEWAGPIEEPKEN